MFRLICFIIGYIIGNIQFSSIVGRLYGINIRDHGSGNPGATNTLRTLGKKAGFSVLALDAFKAVLAYVIASFIFNGDGTFVSFDSYLSILPGIYAGLGTVIGHIYPITAKFKGGKGVACIAGTILAINFFMSITIFILGIAVVIITRYASAANLTVVAVIPIFLYLYNYPLESIFVSLLFVAICFFKHKNNIKALFNGTERVFELSKK